MKMLITLGSLIAALGLGWQYNAAETRAKAAETELGSIKQELEETRSQLSAANAQLAVKPNWIAERNKNWRSSPADAASGNQRVVTVSPSVVAPTASSRILYNDFKGRYWIDSTGAKHYVQ